MKTNKSPSKRGTHIKVYWARIKAVNGKKLISKDKLEFCEQVQELEYKYNIYKKQRENIRNKLSIIKNNI